MSLILYNIKKKQNQFLSTVLLTSIINISQVKFKVTLDKHKTYYKNFG